MSIFDWFETRETDAFARALADDLVGRIPVRGDDHQKKLTPDRLRNAEAAIVARAAAYGRNHDLNWYKKARLGNTLRWLLMEQGYEREFADLITHKVLIAVAAGENSAA